MAIDIVDLPSYKMVIFHSYVSLPEGKGYEKYKLNMFITWEKSKKMSQWIGVVGKIETGNQTVFLPSNIYKYIGVSCKCSHHPSL